MRSAADRSNAVMGTTHGARRHGTGTRNTIVSAIILYAGCVAVRQTNREACPRDPEDWPKNETPAYILF
jgi:hypothetical protein